MCCPLDKNDRSDCKLSMGQHGQAVTLNTEIMLVFGGLVQRQRNFVKDDGEEVDIYNYCKDFYNQETDDFEKTYFYKTCGEELVNDIWQYNIKKNEWLYMKPGANEDLYLYVK